MLMPKKVKHRKQMRGRMKVSRIAGARSAWRIRMKTLEAAWITDRQIEAARIAMTRHIKRGGKIWIRMFPITGDEEAGRNTYGQGKGAPEYWVAVVKPGRILYEIRSVDEKTARER